MQLGLHQRGFLSGCGCKRLAPATPTGRHPLHNAPPPPAYAIPKKPARGSDHPPRWLSVKGGLVAAARLNLGLHAGRSSKPLLRVGVPGPEEGRGGPLSRKEESASEWAAAPTPNPPPNHPGVRSGRPAWDLARGHPHPAARSQPGPK